MMLEEAAKLLQRSNYQILKGRNKAEVTIEVDGKGHLSIVDADYIVKKGKEKYVVVVKKGEEEFDPTEILARRQLIEYYATFHPQGILAVDLQKKEINVVKIRFCREKEWGMYLQFILAILLIFGIIGIIWVMSAVKLL